MRKAIQVSLLVMAFACSARAGDIQNVIAPPPPPPSVAGDIQNGIAAPPPPTSATGEIPNMETTQVTAATFALELLQGLVSLA